MADEKSDVKDGELPVVTLYARPAEEKPYLTMANLEQGTYQECSFYSIRYFIPFSNIGKAFHTVALALEKDIKLELGKVNFLENNCEWDLNIKGKEFGIMLRSKRYKAFPFSYVKTFYLEIEITAQPGMRHAILTRAVEALKKPPVDFDDWAKFMEKTGKKQEEVVDGWKKNLEPPGKKEGEKTLSKLSSLLDEVDSIPDV